MLSTRRDDGDLAVGLPTYVLDRRRAALVDRPWFWLRQVHGADVVVAPADEGADPRPGSAADAVVTRSDRWALAVHTADCAPVALVGDGVVGAVHAGWHGLLAGVVERTVDQMRAIGAGPITAFAGPCIHAECYEFGADDLARVVARYGDQVVGTTATGAPALDVPATVAAALSVSGVDELDVDPTCTSCDPGCFSHRARSDVGRQALVVWLADGKDEGTLDG